MTDLTCRAALAELVEAKEALAKSNDAINQKYELGLPVTIVIPTPAAKRLDAAWAAARAALAHEAVPTGMTLFTESALTALESRIRADERQNCAAELANMHLKQLGRATEHNYFAVASQSIRNSDAAPVAE